MTQANWSLLTTAPQAIANHAVGRNADGRLEVFYIDANGEIRHIWQTSPNGTWSAAALLSKLANASYYSSLAVDSNVDGRLEVFTIAEEALWHIWQTTAGGNWYNTWFSSGKPPGINLDYQADPMQVRNADGRLEVFVPGSDRALWHIWQTTPNGTWSSWASLGTPSNMQSSPGPIAGKNADGRIEVFVVGSDDALWHIWQTTAGDGWYKSWFSSGKPSASAGVLGVDVIQNADGRLEVFAVGTDGAFWRIWQNVPNGTWNQWTSLGTPSNMQLDTGPTVVKNKDGRLEVLIVGSDGALWHTAQVAPGKDWNDWASLGALPNKNLSFGPVVSENSDGRLEVFIASGNELWHAWQVTTGSWG
jgi:hypothetical protein